MRAASTVLAATLLLLAAGTVVPPLQPSAHAAEACSPDHPQFITPGHTNVPLLRLGAQALHRRVTGKGVVVAVVDSGVNADNVHLKGAVEPGRSFVPGFTDAQDSLVPHGTAVAGLVAARRVHGSSVQGLAPGATILPVRVFVSDGDSVTQAGLGPTAGRMAEGIRWAADHGADVINVSMSATSDSEGLESAVAHARHEGALVVASAGNRGAGQHGSRQHKVWPAASKGVLGVSAANADDAVTDWSVHGPQVDVVAPGSDVHVPFLDAKDCYYAGGGHGEPFTSFATPFVSATAALLMQAHPHESPRMIAYRIMASADRPIEARRDDRRGWGFVRPLDALTMTLDPDTAGPPFPGAPLRHAADASSGHVLQLRASADPLGASKHAVAWWLLLGGSAIVLVLLAGRGLALRRHGHPAHGRDWGHDDAGTTGPAPARPRAAGAGVAEHRRP